MSDRSRDTQTRGGRPFRVVVFHWSLPDGKIAVPVVGERVDRDKCIKKAFASVDKSVPHGAIHSCVFGGG